MDAVFGLAGGDGPDPGDEDDKAAIEKGPVETSRIQSAGVRRLIGPPGGRVPERQPGVEPEHGAMAVSDIIHMPAVEDDPDAGLHPQRPGVEELPA